MKLLKRLFYTFFFLFVLVASFLLGGVILYFNTGCGLDYNNRKYVVAEYPYVSKVAGENAQTIIDMYQNLSDLEKLEAYYQKIIELNTYASDATNRMYERDIYYSASSTSYVFDEDENTNVMCWGYAKAFKYLCDNSTFNDDVRCYVVIGLVNGNRNTQHAWNILKINDKYYHLDACFGDLDEWGAAQTYFLVEMPSYSEDYYLNYDLYVLETHTDGLVNSSLIEEESYISLDLTNEENNKKYSRFTILTYDGAKTSYFFDLLDNKLFRK